MLSIYPNYTTFSLHLLDIANLKTYIIGLLIVTQDLAVIFAIFSAIIPWFKPFYCNNTVILAFFTVIILWFLLFLLRCYRNFRQYTLSRCCCFLCLIPQCSKFFPLLTTDKMLYYSCSFMGMRKVLGESRKDKVAINSDWLRAEY